MYGYFTPMINEHNVNTVREQIAQKKLDRPYRTTIVQAGDVLTDYDSFPYQRWWRGVPQSSTPVIAEREAGWRARHDNCYEIQPPTEVIQQPYPNHCFQTACSTVHPCYINYLDKIPDVDLLNTMLNKACIVQYR